jgi:predicted  nucleic acid-binding Zn-ribbon protein
MYATEKYVKMEAKELRETINEAVTDLGGDIRYMHSLVLELQQDIKTLQEQLDQLREKHV